jgi:carboxyl-terminal processing protease
MTIARYYTPSGRCIQREYNGDYQAYLRDEERYEKGALFHEETQKNDPKQRFKTVKGKTVYGGGGISPDVFIPLDTAFNYFYYQNYNVNEAISSFGFDYLEHNRKKWNKISDLKRLEINAQMMLQFQAYAKKNHQMNMDEAAWLKFSPHLKHRIKEEIARQLFQEEGYYEVANEYDQEVQKALKIR